MASAVADESEDFVTCGVCLCEYDEGIKKPKFLPCSHSLCLSCLKGIHSGGFIVCPLCRYVVAHFGEVSALPNNSFALHILQLKQKNIKEIITKKAQRPKNMWCLTCGSLAKSDCHSLSHSCIDMSAVSLKNFEALLTLRNDLKSKVEEGQTKLAEAIEKRREVQNYLSQVAKALKMIAAEVDSLEEENNVLLTELVSLLEGHHHSAEQQQEPCLSELMGLLDDCSSQDTIETLRQKLASKYQPQYEDKLALTAARSTELEKQRKTKITVTLLDESNNPFLVCDTLKEGIKWPVDATETSAQRELLLLSHLIFSLNSHQTHQVENKPSAAVVTASASTWMYVHPFKTSSTVAAQQRSPFSSTSVIPRTIPSTAAAAPSKFILEISNSTKPSLQGQVFIEPPASSVSSFPFTRLLGDWCRTHSLNSLSILKSLPVTCMVMSCVVPPSLAMPIIPHFQVKPPYLADQVGDVGVTQVVIAGGKVTGFSLLFPFERFNDPVNVGHVKCIPPAFLLGRVTNPLGMECIRKVADTKNSERHHFSFNMRFV